MGKKRLEAEPGVAFRNAYHAGNRRRKAEEAAYGDEVEYDEEAPSLPRAGDDAPVGPPRQQGVSAVVTAVMEGLSRRNEDWCVRDALEMLEQEEEQEAPGSQDTAATAAEATDDADGPGDGVHARWCRDVERAGARQQTGCIYL